MDTHTHTHTHTRKKTETFILLCMCVCVYVCVYLISFHWVSMQNFLAKMWRSLKLPKVKTSWYPLGQKALNHQILTKLQLSLKAISWLFSSNFFFLIMLPSLVHLKLPLGFSVELHDICNLMWSTGLLSMPFSHVGTLHLSMYSWSSIRFYKELVCFFNCFPQSFVLLPLWMAFHVEFMHVHSNCY
jgi:hypothetical protein